MGGGGLDGQTQTGGPAAKALRADAQGVDLVQKLLLQLGVEGVGVGLVNGAQQGVLGQRGHLVEGAAHAHSQHNGGAGVGARLLYGFHHEALDALYPVGGAEHGQAAHVLTAAALGSHGDGAAVAGHQMEGNEGRGVVPGVYPAEGVAHNGLAQIALAVAPANALVDSLLKIAVNVDVLAQLHKNTGHPGVLADGQGPLLCHLQVVPQQVQRLFGQGPGLLLTGAVQGGGNVLGQMGVGFHAQTGHCVGDGPGGNGSHNGVPPLSEISRARVSSRGRAAEAARW